MAKIADERIVVEELFALGTLSVMIIAAMIANIYVVAVLIDSKRNLIGKEILIALIAEQVFIGKATGANIGAVMNHSHLAFIMVLLAVLAEAVVFVQAMVADKNAFAVTIDNVPSFRAIILAFLTKFTTIVIAVVAQKFGGKFASAGNAKPISADLEDLEIVGMVLADRNLSVEVRVNPITIAAEAVPARDTNVMFVAAIFFSLPEIGDAFKLGEFALNKVAIKLGFGLSPTSAATRVVKSTLEQESVERLIHEKLPRRFAVIDSFGFVGVGGSEDDKGHVVASVAGTATVVIAIDDVEGVAGSHSVSALVPLGITHGDEMGRVNGHEELEVNLFSGKLVGELREKMLELTVLA